MLKKLRAFASLYRELGLRWTLFRLAYAFRLRTGLLRLQMPMGGWDDYKEHLTAASSRPHFPIPGKIPPTVPWDPQAAVAEADRLLHGEIRFFAHTFVETGFPPNWHKDPLSGFALEPFQHWSQYSDDADADADIKFIWEPNRFFFVYTLVRAYAASGDEKYPQAFWTLIEDWAQRNPPNTGPNWMDGQEIALRLMAWTFGFYAFQASPTSTPERLARFSLYLAAQAERIYRNHSFAVSSHHNHCITEAFALWMVGILFPELKNASKYFALGKKSLEREARLQIFPDGAYSMYSLNYHRFVLHLYLYAIQVSKNYQVPFSTHLTTSVANSIEFLARLIEPQTGQMPLYGSNDGALVLPLNNCDFTDYRPLLQLGWYLIKGERLFEPGPWDEDLFWLCGETALTPSPSPAGKREPEFPSLIGREARGEGEISFPNGGIYLLRSADSRAVIRCTDFASRPSHADQLHVDLWIHGHNLAIDAGTYLYSGEGIWRNGLARTSVHNTVTVDGKDQMTLLSRFTWTNWSKGKVLKHEKDVWQGEHDGYKPVAHKRTVMALDGDRWLVVDHLAAKEAHRYTLHWLLADFPFEQKENGVMFSLNGEKYKVQVGMTEGSGSFSVVRADPNSTRGWRSRYYGHKEPAVSVRLEATQPQVTFWTFFGFEGDVVEAAGNELKINSKPYRLVEGGFSLLKEK
jgi:asparagine synthase (glutamine-hydrolysing)